MKRTTLLPLLGPVLLLVVFLDLAFGPRGNLLWLLALPLVTWIFYSRFRAARPRPLPAKFTEPGRYRVVLQLPGTRMVQVVKEVRVTTGRGLVEAKQLVDSAPVVVVEDLSEQSAELVADRLRAAGARALAAPIEIEGPNEEMLNQ